MRKIVINDYNLSDSDVDGEVVRVKALIINNRGKILLAHNNNTYQFPGGHLEKQETINECIVREIKEETGILLDVEEDPFVCVSTYDNDYFGTGKKVLNTIYYFRFFSDQLPNYDETSYDALEMLTDFNLFYVVFKNLDEFLKKSIKRGTIDKKIGREMLYVLDAYSEKFGGLI